MTRNASAALRANAFVRAGYKFTGWATSASGTKVYDDKQTVKNLTTGSSITLYAVWEALTAQNALYMVVDLSSGSSSSSYPVTYLSAVPSGGWTDTYKTTKLVLRRIEPGTFMQGGSSGRRCTLTKAYYIGVFELTQRQHYLIGGWNPNENSAYPRDKGNTRPVGLKNGSSINGTSGYSWPKSDKVETGSLIGKLRTRTGLRFRLPTEAQWEYACRAGTTGDRYASSVNSIVCHSGNRASDGGTFPVGSLTPNAWGLYDMLGNVQELCIDRYTESFGSTAVVDPVGPVSTGSYPSAARGGHFETSSANCTANSRDLVSWDGGLGTEDGMRLCVVFE